MQSRRLEQGDFEAGVNTLVEAFRDGPLITRIFRDPDASAKLQYFMRCALRYGLRYGECFGNQDLSGVAAWLGPGNTRLTPMRMLRAGMLAAPLRVGWRDFQAFWAFSQHIERVHESALKHPHYYLMAIGVQPERQRAGLGSQLMELILDKARRSGVPIYLETHCIQNVNFYRKHGFHIVSDEVIAELGITNWGMVCA